MCIRQFSEFLERRNRYVDFAPRACIRTFLREVMTLLEYRTALYESFGRSHDYNSLIQ
jgi:hypothetical protein